MLVRVCALLVGVLITDNVSYRQSSVSRPPAVPLENVRRVTGFDYHPVAAWIATVLLVLAGCLFIAVCRQAMPTFDDFCRGSLNPTTEFDVAQRPQGFWPVQVWSYMNWGGRWLASIVAMVLMSPIDLARWYPALIAFIFTVCVAATVYAFRRWVGERGFFVAALLWIVYGASMPAPQDGVFWLTGAIEAHFGWLLALIGGGLIAQESERPRPRAWRIVLAAAAGFGVGGVHELSGLMCSVFLGFVTFGAWRSGSRHWQLWAGLLLAVVAGTAASAGAPGNRVRATMFPSGGDLETTIRVASVQAISSLKAWLFGDLRLWAMTVLLLAHPKLWPKNRPGPRPLAWAAAGWCAAIAVGFVFPSWVLGKDMAGRTLDQVYLVFLCGWILGVVWIAGEIGARGWEIADPLRRAAGSFALVLLTGSVALEGNARLAVQDLRTGRLEGWNLQQRDRVERLRNASGQASVHLPAITVHPAMMLESRISRDPKYAHNLCLAWYFRIREVTADADQ